MISQLGRYEIVGELGQGAMGVVYKAKDPLIDRMVAIKTINLNMALEEKEEYEARFYQEAKAAGRLNHPNIVTIYDVGESGDVAYIAMEFLQGRELRDILNDDARLPVDQVLDIVVQVAQGLAYAHEHGIVHRDVKPSNIMVIRDGHAKITDFGIARMMSSSVRTQTGMVLGSPKYMSPEQVMGKAIDQRSDIFSLGVMLYEMLTGQSPFNGENVNAIMYQILNAVPQPLGNLDPALPGMLNFIIAKALSKDPDDRYQNANEFAVDLRACRDTLPRSGRQIDAPPAGGPAGGEKKLPDAIDVSGRRNMDEKEVKVVAGLSQAFDSAAATMRLAALTASSEDVDEFAKTLKVARPGAEAVSQIAQAVKVSSPASPAAPRPAVRQSPAEPPAKPRSNLILIAVVILILLGIAIALVV